MNRFHLGLRPDAPARLCRLALPLLLAACADLGGHENDPSPMATERAAPARDFEMVGPSQLNLGEAGTWRTTGLPPNTTVYLLWGTEGSRPSCPPQLLGVCLEMAGRLATQARTNGAGNVQINWTPTVGVGDYLMQMAWIGGGVGHTSNAVRLSLVDPALVDTDGDGLNDARELALGTDPRDYDTDGDLLDDGDEVNRYGTNPLAWDTDGGGADDLSELYFETDPRNPRDDMGLFTDTDGDGIIDCLDTEECDGLDNDGNGEIDEGFDSDADGNADCLEESCDCEDNDGDGNVDEGCLYEVTLQASVDDAWEAFIDGAPVGAGAGWNTFGSYTVTVPAGVHYAAVHGWDQYRVVAGFQGAVYVDATPVSVTGDGTWRGHSQDPGPGWETTTGWTSFVPTVGFTWPSSHPMQADGAQWIWHKSGLDPVNFPENWFVSEFRVCGAYEVQDEACDGRDNNGNGLVDEGYPDSDGDGIADCVDREEICDGRDNDGDGLVDDGFPDSDYDGIADCVDVEECDKYDNDGDGVFNEGYPDTDGDGVADCIDRETCDGFDNNGDGQIDEGFDLDGNGVADCFQPEECDCVDNNANGQIDEGCRYNLDFALHADDAFEYYLDGAYVDGDMGWGTEFTYNHVVPAGTHYLAVHAWDVGRVVAGFIGGVWVDGTVVSVTGDGSWLGTFNNPGAGWEYGSNVNNTPNPVAFTWPIGPTLPSIGAQWIWLEDGNREDLYPENWFVLTLNVCGTYETPVEELCNGVDDNGDGLTDEGFTDIDRDGIADCVDDDLKCNGIDDDGDGLVDEGWPDTDMDGIADCVDEETCDGLDNDGDVYVDEGYSDVDGDGRADCVDEETCDGLDNNGNGVTDEGFPDSDGDGIADCVDEERDCNGRDDDGDGLVDEGYPDNDGDGIANCVDEETCDALDNDGDGQVDEGYDADFDGVADCLEEPCETEDGRLWIGDGAGDLWVWDPATNVTSFVVHMDQVMSDIAWGSDGRLYGVGFGIRVIDLATGVSVQKGTAGGNGLVGDASGNLLISGGGTITKFNIGSGATTTLMTDNSAFSAGDLTFAGGELYMAGFAGVAPYAGGLFHVDLTAGAFSMVMPWAYPAVYGAATDAWGNTYGVSMMTVFSVDIAGLSTTPIGTLTMTSAAFGMTFRGESCQSTDVETACDGRDNDGDGLVDEGWPDTDGDGKADCVDSEQCDGLDNDGDAQIDEGFDADGDGIADCFDAEECDCIDNNGDGQIDESCEHFVQVVAQADDRSALFYDGNALGSTAGWSQVGTFTTSTTTGTHYVSALAEDSSGVVVGFRAAVYVDGVLRTATGDAGWLAETTNPGAGWQTNPAAFGDPWSVQGTCGGRWNTNNALDVAGADWIWTGACNRPALIPRSWFIVPIEICPR